MVSEEQAYPLSHFELTDQNKNNKIKPLHPRGKKKFPFPYIYLFLDHNS